MTISLNQQIEEIEYELGMRRKVYPRMKGGTTATKDYHMQRMQAVLATLQWLQKHEPRIRGMLDADKEA